MTLNIPVFKTRVKTAVIYAAVMVTGLLWNEWSFLILFSIVHFGCWHEFQKLASNIISSKENTCAFVGLGVDVNGYFRQY
jgi:phosphatidate cytidylyltransferase